MQTPQQVAQSIPRTQGKVPPNGAATRTSTRVGFATLPADAQCSLVGFAAIASIAIIIIAPGVAWTPPAVVWLLVALVVTTILAACKIHLSLPKQAVSLDIAPIAFAQVVLCRDGIATGVLAAAIAAAYGAIIGSLMNRRRDPNTGRHVPISLYRVTFNVSNCVVSALVAGATYGTTYHWLGDRLQEILPGGSLAVHNALLIPCLGLWVTAYFVVNTFAFATAVALSVFPPNRPRILPLWEEHCAWTWPGYLGAAALAGLMLALEQRGPGWALLPLPLIYCAHSAIQTQATRLQEREESLRELNRTMESVMASLATTIEAKDTHTRMHVQRVQLISMLLAEAVGVRDEELEAIRLASLVHDVGKIAIPERILTKPDKLTKEEFQRMQEHVVVGAMILEPVQFRFPVVAYVESHHERWDGNGYPHRLKGADIPIGGRIITIADTFDALTSDRPYRKAIPLADAIEMMIKQRGTQFDPTLLDKFVEIAPQVLEALEQLALQEGEVGTAPNTGTGMLPDQFYEHIARARSDDLLATFELVERIFQDPTPSGYARALELLKGSIPWDAAVILQLDESESELIPSVAVGLCADDLLRMRLRVGDGISGRVAQKREPLVNQPAIRDVGPVLDLLSNVELTHTLSVPVIYQDRAIAVITLYSSAYEIYQDHHVACLTALAQHLAPELYASRTSRDLPMPVLLDPTTGLFTMRALVLRLEDRLREAHEKERPMTLISLDLGETHRRAERERAGLGDELVGEVARILRESGRRDDIACRNGVADFLVLLENSGVSDAEVFVARVMESVALLCAKHEIRAIFQLGMALFPEQGASFAKLVARAAQSATRHEARLAPLSDGNPFVITRWDGATLQCETPPIGGGRA